MPKVAFQITHMIILVFFQAYREKHMFRLSKGQFIATTSNQAQENSSQKAKRKYLISICSNGLSSYVREGCAKRMHAFPSGFLLRGSSCDLL